MVAFRVTSAFDLTAMLPKNSEMEMPMKKASTKLALFVLGAASLNAALTLPASAQKSKPSDQTCDNPSTARDKVLRPDSRCVRTKSETYTDEQQAYNRLTSFLSANPPTRVTPAPGQVKVYDGVDRNGDPYRIVNGAHGFAGSGSASGIKFTSSNGGSGGGKGHAAR